MVILAWFAIIQVFLKDLSKAKFKCLHQFIPVIVIVSHVWPTRVPTCSCFHASTGWAPLVLRSSPPHITLWWWECTAGPRAVHLLIHLHSPPDKAPAPLSFGLYLTALIRVSSPLGSVWCVEQHRSHTRHNSRGGPSLSAGTISEANLKHVMTHEDGLDDLLSPLSSRPFISAQQMVLSFESWLFLLCNSEICIVLRYGPSLLGGFQKYNST